ncbi:MAG: hypothetical protein EPN26_12285 [Rhodospirillales bacterium]|nr:MAG: hypothetical protein EPN26_12285 [Rhodospirillales bacterium]
MKPIHATGTPRRFSILLGALVSWWFCLDLSSVAFAQSVERTAPDPLPPVQTPDALSGSPGRSRWPDAYDYIQVKRSKLPYWKAGKADAVLDQACRTGRFVPVAPLRLAAVFDGKEGSAVLGVVPKGRHDLLSDPGKLARAGETYYFFSPSWGNCQVFYEGPQPPRRLKGR